MSYHDFIKQKSEWVHSDGFDPVWMPEFLFDFQKSLVEWSIRKGRAAIFADCGMGKTIMQLTFGENVVRKENRPVLLLTPLAVAGQTKAEADLFGIDSMVSRDGSIEKKIVIANYERLHYFNPSDFAAVICDESSILKNYSGSTRDAIVSFMKDTKYRLLCSATPSPNDYTELGNSVEALGIMRRVSMLATYFVHDGGDTGKWRLKGHANNPFWRFVASFARAIRFPSDLGFSDDNFILPEINTVEHVLESKAPEGFLFVDSAVTLDDQRAERRRTIEERCEKVADIANGDDSHFIAWCSLNSESEKLKSLIKDSEEISGSMSIEQKEQTFEAFSKGEIKALVTKPSLAGFGMNWQHCNRMSFFPSHSHEQYYQCVRRCWRFGQKKPVSVHIVTTEAEDAVLGNMKRKESQANEMFANVIRHMKEYYHETKETYSPKTKVRLPSWLNA
jgi:hypothetical protein